MNLNYQITLRHSDEALEEWNYSESDKVLISPRGSSLGFFKIESFKDVIAFIKETRYPSQKTGQFLDRVSIRLEAQIDRR